jgi:hypothetical protein
MSTYTGRCARGAVSYEIAAEPVFAGQCQCRDCQRATGSGHANAMAFSISAVSLTGDLRYHVVSADSGKSVERGFCPSCGSPLVWRFARRPDLAVVMAASLEDPSVFAPQIVMYASRGFAWDRLDPDLPRFATLPPSSD